MVMVMLKGALRLGVHVREALIRLSKLIKLVDFNGYSMSELMLGYWCFGSIYLYTLHQPR